MKIQMNILQIATVAGFLALSHGAFAENAATERKLDNPTSQHPVSLTNGEIRKVDKEAGLITIKHGPLENLGMPGMTMAFSVKDKALLKSLQTGDKVRFAAERLDGRIVVTQIRVQP